MESVQNSSHKPVCPFTQASNEKAQTTASLDHITIWLSDFLAKPHPDLGRSGPVCPFLPMALEKGAITIDICSSTVLQNEIAARTAAAADLLAERMISNPEARPFLAVIVAFPNAHPADVETVQDNLKDSAVERGMMIGEFHQLSTSAGLHNPDFRPLVAPVPMLVVRELIRQDYIFLSDCRRYDELRVKRLLTSYEKHFERRAQSRKEAESVPTI